MRLETRSVDKERLKEFPTRIVVFGSRGFTDMALFDQCMRKYLKDNDLDKESDKVKIVFLVGMTKTGGEFLIYQWAKEHGYRWSEFYPNWDDVDTEGAVIRYRDGKPYNSVAAFWRDEEMAEVCTHGVSFYDGVSTGTQNMIDRVADKGSPCAVYVVTIELKEDNNHAQKPRRC